MVQKTPVRNSASDAPPVMPAVSTPTEARKLADRLLESMTALLQVIERETALVRTGKIREALTMEKQKSKLSRHYMAGLSLLKASHPYMQRATPDLLTGLTRHHETFRAMLQVNLTVLATAHAVSEGIIRGVNAELQKKRAPSTYTASGTRTTPNPRNAAPFAVSRTL